MILLVLSIQPRFVRMILSGEKTVELRRRSPRRPPDFWAALYATVPERAILGIVRIREVIVRAPDELWPIVEHNCGLGRHEFRGYYEGASRAVALRLVDPIPFEDRLTLDKLRRLWPEFKPPQSFAYLSRDRTKKLLDHAGLCSGSDAVYWSSTEASFLDG